MGRRGCTRERAEMEHADERARRTEAFTESNHGLTRRYRGAGARAGFLWRERFEKRACDVCPTAHGAETTPRPDWAQAREAHDRRFSTGNDHLIATLGLLHQT